MFAFIDVHCTVLFLLLYALRETTTVGPDLAWLAWFRGLSVLAIRGLVSETDQKTL